MEAKKINAISIYLLFCLENIKKTDNTLIAGKQALSWINTVLLSTN